VAEGGALLRRYGGECLHRGFESLLLRSMECLELGSRSLRDSGVFTLDKVADRLHGLPALESAQVDDRRLDPSVAHQLLHHGQLTGLRLEEVGRDAGARGDLADEMRDDAVVAIAFPALLGLTRDEVVVKNVTAFRWSLAQPQQPKSTAYQADSSASGRAARSRSTRSPQP
jgi:hypothetical protein